MQSVIQDLPSCAGVYQYFDTNGKLLYVGKAKNLKNRVKSYWRFSPEFKPNTTQSSRIIKMLHEASRLEYIVVETEEDALILENSLIKQLKPKYNILLRDDKTYPYIYIDESGVEHDASASIENIDFANARDQMVPLQTLDSYKFKDVNLIKIDGEEIGQGQNAHICLNVSRLPSGTQIHINIHVYRSKNPGPTMLILGGLHGDEVNGVEIVRRIVASSSLNSLQKGSVIAIPLLNVFGFINFSRTVTDGKDVNRSFPGSKMGSLASRVAYMMRNEILPNIDFGIDFHTGGSTINNHPQLRVTRGDERALELAKVFASPIILKNRAIPKSLRLHAHKMGKPILVFEGGESLRMDDTCCREEML